MNHAHSSDALTTARKANALLAEQLAQVRAANAELITDKDNLSARNALLDKKVNALVRTSESLVRDKDRLLTELDAANALTEAQAKDLAQLDERCNQRTQWMHTWLTEHQGELLSGSVSAECVAVLVEGLAQVAAGTYEQWLEDGAVDGQNADPEIDHVHVETDTNPSNAAEAIAHLFSGIAGLLQTHGHITPGAKLTFEFVKD